MRRPGMVGRAMLCPQSGVEFFHSTPLFSCFRQHKGTAGQVCSAAPGAGFSMQPGKLCFPGLRWNPFCRRHELSFPNLKRQGGTEHETTSYHRSSFRTLPTTVVRVLSFPGGGGDGMRESLSDFWIRTGEQSLLTQWDLERNGTLRPSDVSYGSKRRVWWRCEQGHQWLAPVYVRTGSQTRCPYCVGKRPIPGRTDLATRHPEVAAQWHPTKNQPLTPGQILPGSHRMVWWQCEQGHEWKAVIKSRTEGCGCPVCANRKISAENNLAAVHPELANQWHPTKNGALTPGEVLAGSHRRAWWQCPQGHVWQAQVISRSQGGAGCPFCAGKRVIPGQTDLAAVFPQVAAQWHPSRNGTVTPQQLSPYSNRKTWWLCDRGHAYSAAVAARTMSGSGCPYCAGRKVLAGFNDLATLRPKVAAQWHPTLNGSLTPEMVTAGSRQKVWWQCADGHVWKAVVYSRTGPHQTGCPVCAGNIKRQTR